MSSIEVAACQIIRPSQVNSSEELNEILPWPFHLRMSLGNNLSCSWFICCLNLELIIMLAVFVTTLLFSWSYIVVSKCFCTCLANYPCMNDDQIPQSKRNKKERYQEELEERIISLIASLFGKKASECILSFSTFLSIFSCFPIGASWQLIQPSHSF